MTDTKIKPDWEKELQKILTNFKDGYYRQYKGVGTEIQIVQNIISNLIRKLLAKQEEQHKMEILGEAAKLATKDINKLKQQHRAELEKSKLEGFRWGVNYLATLINHSTLISELYGWKNIVDMCVEKAHELTKTNIPDHVKDQLLNSQKGK